jgi:mannosyl-oligosaccharide alpha-1,2-mannosidase
MFALGSKMFGIPDDMILAEKLTDGCVWAYESTPVGIMAEDFELVPCDSLTSCTWNETKWHDALDPRLEERIQAVEAYNLKQKQLHEELAAHEEGLTHDAEVVSDPSMRKREGAAQEEPEGTSVRDNDEESSNEAAAVIPSPYVPRMPLSHEKYVAARLMEERLPPGYTKMKSGDYRLRPEAIESVFIMYRITGDETWRAKGWAMFDAVDRATRTEIANAGIKDVTSQLLEQEDTMESFWLAETLKYYYLLFSEPDLISLDDYVLNTEAHPFKRPR